MLHLCGLSDNRLNDSLTEVLLDLVKIKFRNFVLLKACDDDTGKLKSLVKSLIALDVCKQVCYITRPE